MIAQAFALVVLWLLATAAGAFLGSIVRWLFEEIFV